MFWKPKRYTYRYYAIGMMGNKYTAGEFTFTATKKEVKKLGSIPNVGFYKNNDLLERHYKIGSDGLYSYTCKRVAVPLSEYLMMKEKSDERIHGN